LAQRGASDFKILIDFGVAVATQDAATTMAKVFADVMEASGGSVDVLAVTHEHWDHVSGFQQVPDFGKLAVGDVWVAWTEDASDALAKQLRDERAKALSALTASAQALHIAGQPGRAEAMLAITSQFGAAGEKTANAFDIAKRKAKDGTPRYWRPTDPPLHIPGADAKIYALGPPHDAKRIRQVLPSKAHPETYQLALDGSGVFPAGVSSALLDQQDAPPMSSTVTIPVELSRAIPFFQNHYWGSLGETATWRKIDTEWLGSADDLALALQSATNNTSLVLAIELAGGDVMLFAGDAQVGNWLSWQDCKWPQDNPTVAGPDLLKRTIFYKVGHHGSYNATLREKGLEQMANLKTAVIPVDEMVAKKMRWGAMPLEGLVTRLQEKTNKRAFRTDKQPTDKVDGVTVTDLYYEFAI
jgi:beta-lactamase superfamily II metal-dependent hydrolase